jgi:hypothetical protein
MRSLTRREGSMVLVGSGREARGAAGKLGAQGKGERAGKEWLAESGHRMADGARAAPAGAQR